MVYTVRFARAVYALHAFQKKSKKGIKTPQFELEIVRKRLKEAEEDHAKRRAEEDAKRKPGHH
jgi:phage-related protein